MSGNHNRDSVFVVAELSGNHGGRIETARDSIRAIAETGADAVKLQTYTADTMTINCDRPEFADATRGTIWEGRGLYDLYREAHTPWEWHRELKELADSLGLIFFSAPFDRAAVEFLEDLSVPLYKIASFEITDIPLIEYTALTGKPMILSTGIANAGDIQLAVDSCRRMGNQDITLLQCTSAYPAPVELSNLRMIRSLAETFGVASGLSDHTAGTAVAVAAVALGAQVIEKHFILDKSIGGPDASFSMIPSEFASMVRDIRAVEQAMGTIDYGLTDRKLKSRRFARSLYVVQDIPRGERITQANVRSIRPGGGLHPQHLPAVLGKTTVRDLLRGEPLSLLDLTQEE